jgi:hypothetical protein
VERLVNVNCNSERFFLFVTLLTEAVGLKAPVSRLETYHNAKLAFERGGLMKHDQIM